MEQNIKIIHDKPSSSNRLKILPVIGKLAISQKRENQQ